MSIILQELSYLGYNTLYVLSTMWCNGTVSAMRKLRTAYNSSLRRLLGIPKYHSASEMFVQLNIKKFGVTLMLYIWTQ